MKKTKRRFFSFAAALLLVFAMAMPAFADSMPAPESSPFTDDEWNSIIPYLSEEEIAEMSTPEYWMERQQYATAAEQAYKDHLRMRDNRNHTLSVPLIMQENSRFCGPASIQMIMRYFGKNATQMSIAKSVMESLVVQNGVATSGYSSAQKMASYLSSNTGCTTYSTQWLNESRTIYQNVWYSISRGYPVVASVVQNLLPNNNGASSDGHIVVITGYYNEGQPSMGGGYYYNDPHYNSAYYGQFTCAAQVMNTAILKNQRYYITA